MITWTAIENAVYTWVNNASSLPVWWSNGGAPRPTGQYIALTAVLTPRTSGWTEYSDADPVISGAELDETVRHISELAITLTCFGGAATESTRPSAVLETVMANARLSSVRVPLTLAGWAPSRFGPMLNIGGVLGGSIFEPRSEMQCFGFVNSEIVGAATYIQITEVENTISGETTTLDSEA
jgi:hypothetical protein